jgi:DNA mismatch repair protein MutS
MMEIDPATRRNLELTRTLEGETKGSLLSTLDCTATAPGSRMLAGFLAAPLTDAAAIHTRQNRVAAFMENRKLRRAARDILKTTPDMERALARLTIGRGGPRDMDAIREGVLNSGELRKTLIESNSSDDLGDLRDALSPGAALDNVQEILLAGLDLAPPALAREGGFIRDGYSRALNEVKVLRDDSLKLIADLQGKYRAQTGIETLKVSFNNMLGYFLEVPAKRADSMLVRKGEADNPFVHRQTMANAVRFSTPELAQLESRISSAADRALAIELGLFNEFLDAIKSVSEDIGRLARTLAALDVFAALAELAEDRDYVRPVIDMSTAFHIENGRHPVVEAAALQDSAAFVPNDCDLSAENSLWLLTGPNMAGKSTFLRQNALIAIMAQIGACVPASAAHIGIIDRLFSRVGASDDLARGRSTFMVEMVETAAILNQSTARSLVILDEIGRGTSTFDGLSIAWACIEHLHEVNQCRTLFATHYHELTSLHARLERLSCHAMQVREWKGDIIFMHKVGEGTADRSYGIHVGKLAGLPAPVIERAREVLDLLQEGEQGNALTKLSEDLPLFTASRAAAPKNAPSIAEEKLAALDLDSMTAKDALDFLYALKREIAA